MHYAVCSIAALKCAVLPASLNTTACCSTAAGCLSTTVPKLNDVEPLRKVKAPFLKAGSTWRKEKWVGGKRICLERAVIPFL